MQWVESSLGYLPTTAKNWFGWSWRYTRVLLYSKQKLIILHFYLRVLANTMHSYFRSPLPTIQDMIIFLFRILGSWASSWQKVNLVWCYRPYLHGVRTPLVILDLLCLSKTTGLSWSYTFFFTNLLICAFLFNSNYKKNNQWNSVKGSTVFPSSLRPEK